MSTLLEVQGNWERRRDDRTGMIFFRQVKNVNLPNNMTASITNNLITEHEHSVDSNQENNLQSSIYRKTNANDELYSDTCQWEVPAIWEGDALAIPSDGTIDLENDLHNDSVSQLSSHNLQLTDITANSATFIPQTPGQKPTSQPNNQFDGDFEQPNESWVPGTDLLIDGFTPGSMARPNARPTDKHSLLTNNLEMIAEDSQTDLNPVVNDVIHQLLDNDGLMQALASRLGLPLNNIKDRDMIHSNSLSYDALNAPRDTVSSFGDELLDEDNLEFDSDGDNDEAYDGVGDYDHYNDPDLLPNEPKPVRKSDKGLNAFKSKHMNTHDRKNIQANKSNQSKTKTMNENNAALPKIPYLDLLGKGVADAHVPPEAPMWRTLPAANIAPTFFQSFTQTKVCGPNDSSSNSLNSPVFLIPLSPVDACHYVPEPMIYEVESIFIPNIKEELQRAITTLGINSSCLAMLVHYLLPLICLS